MYRLQTGAGLLLRQELLRAKKENPAMPIQKIPTVSRRIHPAAITGAAMILVGLAITLTALIVRA